MVFLSLKRFGVPLDACAHQMPDVSKSQFYDLGECGAYFDIVNRWPFVQRHFVRLIFQHVSWSLVGLPHKGLQQLLIMRRRTTIAVCSHCAEVIEDCNPVLYVVLAFTKIVNDRRDWRITDRSKSHIRLGVSTIWKTIYCFSASALVIDRGSCTSKNWIQNAWGIKVMNTTNLENFLPTTLSIRAQWEHDCLLLWQTLGGTRTPFLCIGHRNILPNGVETREHSQNQMNPFFEKTRNAEVVSLSQSVRYGFM